MQTLLLSKDALLKFTTGHVVDLISNDVQRIEEDTIKILFISIPSCFVFVVSAVLLVYLIGWQTIMGVFFLCLLVPYFTGFSYISAALRLRTAAVSDRRISLMNQVVSGIRAIKTRAWEDEYRKKIQHTRRYRCTWNMQCVSQFSMLIESVWMEWNKNWAKLSTVNWEMARVLTKNRDLLAKREMGCNINSFIVKNLNNGEQFNCLSGHTEEQLHFL